MKQPHKHKDAIIAWANGEQIEYRNPLLSMEWQLVDFPAWGDKVEYRVKPKEVIRHFQVALLNAGHGYITTTTDDAEQAKAMETSPCFVAWLTDPIPYQVEELD